MYKTSCFHKLFAHKKTGTEPVLYKLVPGIVKC